MINRNSFFFKELTEQSSKEESYLGSLNKAKTYKLIIAYMADFGKGVGRAN